MAKETKDEAAPPVSPTAIETKNEADGKEPVNPNYVRNRIAAQDARKESARPGSSKPAKP